MYILLLGSCLNRKSPSRTQTEPSCQRLSLKMGDTPKAWIQENYYKLCVTRGVSECSQPCYIAVLLVMHLCYFFCYSTE